MTDCYHCGSDEHLYHKCPARSSGAVQPYAKADTFIEHMQRIEGYVALWLDGKLTMYQKRAAIAGENLQWYGQHTTRGGICLTRP